MCICIYTICIYICIYVYIRSGTYLPNNVYSFDKTLERTSSAFESDKRSVIVSHFDWLPITHTHQLMRRRLGIIVSPCAEGSESENRVRTCATECSDLVSITTIDYY